MIDLQQKLNKADKDTLKLNDIQAIIIDIEEFLK